MHLVKIDIVGAKTSQACGEGVFKPGGGVVEGGHAPSVETNSKFRRDRYVLAATAQGLSESDFDWPLP
jgi:hypothetical protein